MNNNSRKFNRYKVWNAGFLVVLPIFSYEYIDWEQTKHHISHFQSLPLPMPYLNNIGFPPNDKTK